MIALNKLDKSFSSPDDPRQYFPTGRHISASEPTANGKMCLNDVKLGCYDSYDQIRAGQIEYYVDPDNKTPFYAALFGNDNRHDIIIERYIDPNGIAKPHFHRIALSTTDCCENKFIGDSQLSRDDLLASNMWRRNQQKFDTGI